MKVSSISPISYTGHNNSKVENDKDKNLKAKVAATTALSVGVALAHIAKKEGFSLSPSAIKKTPVKDWAIFKLYNKNNPNAKEINLEEIEIIELASASVLGGLAGGAIFDDKKHMKAKFRESVNQFLGNVLVPVGCVGLVSRLYKANKERILSIVPQIKETGQISKNFNKALKGVPFSIATIGALATGIITGNRVSNVLNEKIFHKKVDRKIKGTDFAPHVDDLGMAVSLMADKSPFVSFIQRTVPAFLCVPGIEVGTHRD